MLHYAAGLRSPEGVQIVALLLRANADPNVTAMDGHLSYEFVRDGKVSTKSFD